MTGTSLVVRKSANEAPAQTCVRKRTNVRVIGLHDVAMQKAQFFWTGKVIWNLADRTKRSVRTAQYWQSRKREMDLGAFVALASDLDVGAAFVDAFMSAIPPQVRAQWVELQRQVEKAAKAAVKKHVAEREVAQAQLDLSAQVMKLGIASQSARR